MRKCSLQSTVFSQVTPVKSENIDLSALSEKATTSANPDQTVAIVNSAAKVTSADGATGDGGTVTTAGNVQAVTVTQAPVTTTQLQQATGC